MDIYEHTDTFLRHLAMIGRSERTQKDYATILRKFAEFQLRRRRLVRETTQEDLGAYVLQMRALKLSETAIRLYTTVVRGFFLWMTDEDLIQRDPSRKLRYGHTKTRVVKIPPMPLYQTLLESIPGTTAFDRRDRTIVSMLFNTGLRVSELCSLRVDSIDLESGDFLVLGKGGYLRQGLVSGRALWELRWWVQRYRPLLHPSTRALFVGPMGGPLGAMQVQVMFRKRSDAAGIHGRYQYPSGATLGLLTPHSLRHLHASRLLEIGVPLPVIQASLGHLSLSSTMVYLKPSQQSLREAHSRLDASMGDDLNLLEIEVDQDAMAA